jgi:hypothetical protein
LVDCTTNIYTETGALVKAGRHDVSTSLGRRVTWGLVTARPQAGITGDFFRQLSIVFGFIRLSEANTEI